MRTRKDPGRRPGFTRGETGAIVLLAAGLLAGSLVRLAGGGAPADVAPAFDYAAGDSAFHALADTGAHPEEPAAAHGVRTQSRKPPPPGTPLDLNSASRDDLVRLPGVGGATADRIIDERTRGGPFARVEDLCRVRGIGPKKLAALRPYVTVR